MIRGSRQRGATLIEVLVAIIVLSIGLLGMAGLQAASVQSNYSAYYRSQATILASDITDRMRANRAAALADSYNLSTATASHSETSTRVDKDLNEWLGQVSKLPEGTGQITRDATTGIFTITINWNDSRGSIKKADGSSEAGDAAGSFIYRTEI